MKPPPTAAALVIGNELLTGKVEDQNVPILAALLFELGIVLERVVFCRDSVEVIAAELDGLRHNHDHVFTSGGVGPTHDDVTMAGVARAFGRPLVVSAEIEGLLRSFYGERFHDGHLRLARVPEGTELVMAAGGRWPIVAVGNVFVLPGLPEIFRRKMPVLREHLGGGVPFTSRSVLTAREETEIASLLERLAGEHPAVEIGSYPRWGDGPVKVAVTFDGRDPDAVGLAVQAFQAALPPDSIVAPEERP